MSAHAARNFPAIISQSCSGFVVRSSIVPAFFSSASRRIVTAGTTKRNTSGIHSNIKRSDATLIRNILLVYNQPTTARNTTMTT